MIYTQINKGRSKNNVIAQLVIFELLQWIWKLLEDCEE